MKARTAALILLLSGSVVCGMAAQKRDQKATASPSNGTAKTASEPDGEKLFRAHCNRCHNAPDELSPRVARTVVQHMRVRGMLPEREVQAILDYLAPE